MGKIRSLATVIFFVMAAGIGGAQADTAKREAVIELMKTTNTVEIMEKVATNALRALLAQQYAQHPEIPEDVRQKTFEILQETFRENLEAILADLSQVYEQEFTLEELQELNHFYKSELGQKIIVSTPNIMQKSMIIGSKWGGNIGIIAMERIKKELASKGYNI